MTRSQPENVWILSIRALGVCDRIWLGKRDVVARIIISLGKRSIRVLVGQIIIQSPAVRESKRLLRSNTQWLRNVNALQQQ